MKKSHQLTAIIEKEDNAYVALCLSETEIKERLHNEIFITSIDVAIGQVKDRIRR